MNRKALFAVLCSLAVATQAADGPWTPVFEDAFDRPESAANWNLTPGFSLDGKGLLVWREDKPRPAPRQLEATLDRDGNRVFPEGWDPTGCSTLRSRRFPVEPGCRYALLLRVRQTLERLGGTAHICWYGRDGRELGRAEVRPGINRELPTNEWTTVKAMSLRLPSEAVTGAVDLQLYRRATGRVEVDKVMVAQDAPVAVGGVYSSAFRASAGAGRVTFGAPICVSPTRHPATALSGTFTFEGADGPFTVAADSVADDVFTVTVDVARLAVGTHPVRALLRHGTETLGAGEGTFTRLARQTARPVDFDAQFRMRVNGTPFLPLGVFVSPTDYELAFLDRLRGGPFNCVVECSSRRRVLDKVRAAGLMAIPKAPPSVKNAAAAVPNARNHPALLAWYVIDETQPDRADVKRGLYETVSAADPEHPAFAVFDRTANAPAFMGAYDIISDDPYKISFKNRTGSLDVAKSARASRRHSFGLRPVWQVPQAFAWKWCRKGHEAEDRYPTFAELRSMSWQAVAGGANGLLWFSAGMIFRNLQGDALETCWGELVRVAAEIRAHEDDILADEVEVTSVPANAAARAFVRGGTIRLLVTSTGGAVNGPVSVKSASAVSVDLPPLGVRWLNLPLVSEK